MNFVNLSDEEARVTGLQEMLRLVGLSMGNDALIVPVTGVFDDATQKALEVFQKISGLPQTGSYDFQTWNRLFSEYEKGKNKISRPKSISPFPNNSSYEVNEGENSELVFIIQLMLNALRMNYNIPYVPLSGILDAASCEAVKQFQKINSLPQTGCVNKETWDRMTDEYNATVNSRQ